MILGFGFRLILTAYVSSYPERFIQSDAIGYDQIALNLISGHGFSMKPTAPYIPDNFRTPGYPILIASIYGLFGHQPAIILYLQAFLGAFTCLIVYYIGRTIASPKVGLIAAIFLVISPHSITYTAVLWSDTTYTLVLTVSLWLTTIMFNNFKLKWVVLSSLFLGLATLFHPRSLYLPALIVLLIVLSQMKMEKWRSVLAHTGIYVSFFALSLLPWIVRNYMVFGVPNVTSVAGKNMLYYGAALTEASRTGEDQWSIMERYEAEIYQMSEIPLNEAEFAKLAFQYGWRKAIDHPLSYLRTHIIGSIKVFLPGTFTIRNLLTGKADQDMREIYSLFISNPLAIDTLWKALSNSPLIVWGFVAIDSLFLLFIYMLIIYELVFNRYGFRWNWHLALVALYLALIAGPAGAPRFRVAMMPILVLLAACGLNSIISRSLARRPLLSFK